jgi:hypothetical protein
MARPYHQLLLQLASWIVVLTRIALKPDFPTMSLSHSSISNTFIPELPNSLFDSLTNVSLGVYDPYPIIRVECNCHKYRVWIWFALEER